MESNEVIEIVDTFEFEKKALRYFSYLLMGLSIFGFIILFIHYPFLTIYFPKILILLSLILIWFISIKLSKLIEVESYFKIT